MNPETTLRIIKGVGGIVASIVAEKIIEKIGRKIIIAKFC